MNTSEQIKQLTPARTPVELLQLLRKLHDNYLLLDPGFMEDANVLRLFGPGTVKQVWPYGKQDEITWKNFLPDAESSLATAIRFLSRLHGEEYIFGDINLTPISPASAYPADLVEQHFLHGVKGEDPLSPYKGKTNEAMDAAARRPRPTHPKGYFEYQLFNQAGLCSSKVLVRMKQNGTLLEISLEQKKVTK